MATVTNDQNQRIVRRVEMAPSWDKEKGGSDRGGNGQQPEDQAVLVST